MGRLDPTDINKLMLKRYTRYQGFASIGVMVVVICLFVATAIAEDKLTPEEITGYNETVQSSLESLGLNKNTQWTVLFDQSLRTFLEADSNDNRFFQQAAIGLWSENADQLKTAMRTLTQEMIRRGVTVNRAYQTPTDAFLLSLGAPHKLSDESEAMVRELFAPWWQEFNLKIPVINTIDSPMFDSRDMRKNATLFDFVFIYPLAIEREAIRYNVDSGELIESIAVHEIVHSLLMQMFDFDTVQHIAGKLNRLEKQTGGNLNLVDGESVIEFLADATQARLGNTSIRLLAARVVRSGVPIGTTFADPVTGSPRLRHSHDASALFMHNLMLEWEKNFEFKRGENTLEMLTEKSMDPEEYWYITTSWAMKYWNPYLAKLITPEFENTVISQYNTMFHVILDELTE